MPSLENRMSKRKRITDFEEGLRSVGMRKTTLKEDIDPFLNPPSKKKLRRKYLPNTRYSNLA